MDIQVGCIVEGHGDVEAVPILLRRIAAHLDPALNLITPKVIRVPRDRLLKRGELEKAVDLAARNTSGQGAVLAIIDSDDDCPKELAPHALERARVARNDVPLAVVLAKREFESWFLAAAESLRGHRGLPGDLEAPMDPEAIRGAKEWLGGRMTHGHRYRETIEQPALTAVFDFQAARMAGSFDKCYREVVRLLTELRHRQRALVRSEAADEGP